MKKFLFLAASAAVALSSCAKIQNGPDARVNDDRTALNFGVYVPKVSKAGAAGEMDNDKLRSTGFGVIAYEQEGTYDGSVKPTFMYNQLVEYASSVWTYSPVKYWPNQLNDEGTTDGQGAWSQKAHTVSFFAYAPYVASAGGTEGIIAMSAASATGDPTVTYKVSSNLDKNVDLVWGTSDGATWANVAGGYNTVAAGMPYLNLQKPAIGTKVNFKFYHALAQLNLTAVGSYNIAGIGGTAKNGVKITISAVELTIPGQYDEAVLNLNNTAAKTPLWDVTGATESELTLAVSGGNLNDAVKDAGAVAALSQPAGVTATEGPVLANSKYYTLIPRTASTDVTVKVTYYVTTDDANLDDGFSRVPNVIKKTITFPNGFKAGTKNNIRMILGLSEVELSGEVVDWETGDTIEVYLPKNVE